MLNTLLGDSQLHVLLPYLLISAWAEHLVVVVPGKRLWNEGICEMCEEAEAALSTVQLSTR